MEHNIVQQVYSETLDSATEDNATVDSATSKAKYKITKN